jgi:hypothetical protein
MKNVEITGQTILEKLMYHGAEMVDVNISYPAVGSDAAPPHCARRVNARYEREAQEQRLYAGESMYDDAVADYAAAVQNGYPFHTYELMQVYAVPLNAYPLLSLYFDVYRYTGGAHGMTERSSDTWDLARCRKLEMKRLFARGYDYARPIFAYVEAEAERRMADGEAQYFDGLADNIVRYFNEKNYYLTCQGLVVYYPLYSIAPYYVGIQEFTVPYGMFGNNMTYQVPELCM